MTKLLLALPLIFLSACATVVRGAKDTAKIESDPTGATVTTESISEDRLGPYTCKTPCELELKCKRSWGVTFEREGYKPAEGRLDPRVTGGGVASGLGNALAGGIIGLGVDAGTGANMDLRPNPMRAELAPNDSEEESRILGEKEQFRDQTKKAPEVKSAPEPAAVEPPPQPAPPAAPKKPAAPKPEPVAPAEPDVSPDTPIS